MNTSIIADSCSEVKINPDLRENTSIISTIDSMENAPAYADHLTVARSVLSGLNVQPTRTGIRGFDQLSLSEQMETTVRLLESKKDSLNWHNYSIGDCYGSMTIGYGEHEQVILERFGKLTSVKNIQNLASIAKQWSEELREDAIDLLPWGAIKELAPESDQSKREYIRRWRAGELTVDKIRQERRAAKTNGSCTGTGGKMKHRHQQMTISEETIFQKGDVIEFSEASVAVVMDADTYEYEGYTLLTVYKQDSNPRFTGLTRDGLNGQMLLRYEGIK